MSPNSYLLDDSVIRQNQQRVERELMQHSLLPESTTARLIQLRLTRKIVYPLPSRKWYIDRKVAG
jgi:hypothetical protein